MKTIQQLQKVAKRLTRMKRKCQQILAKGRRGGKPLEDDQIGSYNMRILNCENGLRLLALELFNRNIGQPAKRDARPLKVQRQFGLIPAIVVA